MYNSVKQLSLAFLLTAGLFSCGKKDDSPAPSGGGSGDSNWKIGSYTYSRAASSQTSSGGPFTAIVVTTSGNGGNYGAYSGSSLTFTMNSNLGAGTYTLGNLNQLIAAGPSAKVLVMDCGIGTAVNTGSTFYSSASVRQM